MSSRPQTPMISRGVKRLADSFVESITKIARIDTDSLINNRFMESFTRGEPLAMRRTPTAYRQDYFEWKAVIECAADMEEAGEGSQQFEPMLLLLMQPEYIFNNDLNGPFCKALQVYRSTERGSWFPNAVAAIAYGVANFGEFKRRLFRASGAMRRTWTLAETAKNLQTILHDPLRHQGATFQGQLIARACDTVRSFFTWLPVIGVQTNLKAGLHCSNVFDSRPRHHVTHRLVCGKCVDQIIVPVALSLPAYTLASDKGYKGMGCNPQIEPTILYMFALQRPPVVRNNRAADVPLAISVRFGFIVSQFNVSQTASRIFQITAQDWPGWDWGHIDDRIAPLQIIRDMVPFEYTRAALTTPRFLLHRLGVVPIARLSGLTVTNEIPTLVKRGAYDYYTYVATSPYIFNLCTLRRPYYFQ